MNQKQSDRSNSGKSMMTVSGVILAVGLIQVFIGVKFGGSSAQLAGYLFSGMICLIGGSLLFIVSAILLSGQSLNRSNEKRSNKV